MQRPPLLLSAMLSMAMLAGTLALGATTAGAQTSANPRGVSCTVTPGDPGVNEQISYDFNGTTEPVFLREVTANGSTYLASIFPGGGTSSSISPLGYVIRYRANDVIIDIPCDSDDPESSNPANVSCSTFVLGGTRVELDRGDIGNGVLHIRRSNADGSSAWLASAGSADGSPILVAGDPDDVFLRYRLGSDVFEVPCDGPEPQSISCEYFTIDGDQIGLIVTGAPDGLNVFVREYTSAGSRFVTDYDADGLALPTSDGYFIRYRQAGDVLESGCLAQPF